MPIKFWITAVCTTLVLVIVFLFVWQYNQLKAENRQLTIEKQSLKDANQLQQETLKQTSQTIESWKKAQVEFTQLVKDFRDVQLKAKHQSDKLNEIFAKHDLDKIARAKPILLQNRLNDGTERSRLMLQCASGDRASCDEGGTTAGASVTETSPPNALTR